MTFQWKVTEKDGLPTTEGAKLYVYCEGGTPRVCQWREGRWWDGDHGLRNPSFWADIEELPPTPPLSGGTPMSLAAKIKQLCKYGNEIAIGYDDCCSLWILHYGRRGAGAMIDGCGLKLRSEEDDFEKAVDEFLEELLRLHGPR